MASPKTIPPYSITLVGCGKMGGAMMKSWLKNALVSQANIIDPSPLNDDFKNDEKVQHFQSLSEQKINTDILVLAIKPQILEQVTKGLSSHISKDTLVLSIAAGQSLKTLEKIFTRTPVIRVMPNTPAAIGKGMNVAIANVLTQENQKKMASDLLGACGKVEWLEDENLMDAVTALSGSGPAYVFHFVEALAKSGENLGLSPESSMILARQTLIGSAALMESEKNLSAETLRQNVTSPGGTTQAALNVMMDGRFQKLINESLSAAKQRSKELG